MTTTPLPPPDTHCFDEDTNMDVWSYSAPLVDQIVKQARADLEAENQRLREALQEAAVHIAARWGDSDPHAIKAFTALEKQP